MGYNYMVQLVVTLNAQSPSGGMADAADSKSADRNIVGVRVPSRAGCRHEHAVLRREHNFSSRLAPTRALLA